MSSLYVRNLVDQWATSQTDAPFHSTINNVPDPDDDIWFTLDFESFGSTVETFCGDVLEEGEIRLIFFGRVGIGYQALMEAAEIVSASLMELTDPAGQLVLQYANPPVDFAGENNPWFVVEIAVDYQQRSA